MKDAGGIADELKLLISPYWNVNMEVSAWDNPSIEAFNLSILECKCKHLHGR